MGLKAPPSQRHDIQILTNHFQFSGQLETVGPPGNFINDPSRHSLSLYDVRTAPLTPGSPLKGIFRPHVVVRKSHIVLLYFASAETRASISTYPRRELLMIYTPVAVCRGYFHVPTEARLRDFLDVIPGSLLPVTEARIFPFVEFSASFPVEAELVLVGHSHVLLYHTA
jgi:hypothetical protein